VGGTEHRSNNFDAIRLLAAAAVIVGHAWPLTGTPAPPAVGGIAIFHLAVFVFFSLSGYLVGTSWIHDPRPWPFLIRRASRIFPALVVVVTLTILAIGPATTSLPWAEYFASPVTWAYFQNVTLVATYDLPGVFEHLPRPVVNGSLWTLGPEFVCYLGVLAVGIAVRAVRAQRRTTVAAVVFSGMAVVLAILSIVPELVSADVQPTTEAMTFFAIGAALAQLRLPRVPARPAIALAGVWTLGVLATEILDIVWCWIALPYLVLAIGSRAAPVIRRVGRFGDFSYGMYLWGFPVQQVVFQAVPHVPLALNILIVLLVTGVLAALSWHFVEAPTLRLGRRWAARRLQLVPQEPGSPAR
jgi:peptidoglycan/LPS O-acetylase OafA/YrhL